MVYPEWERFRNTDRDKLVMAEHISNYCHHILLQNINIDILTKRSGSHYKQKNLLVGFIEKGKKASRSDHYALSMYVLEV